MTKLIIKILAQIICIPTFSSNLELLTKRFIKNFIDCNVCSVFELTPNY